MTSTTSTTSSTTSTSSQVLARKLAALEQDWTAQKRRSPIQQTAHRWRRRRRRRTTRCSQEEEEQEQDPDRQQQRNNENDDEEEEDTHSVEEGGNSVSTLGSTESSSPSQNINHIHHHYHKITPTSTTSNKFDSPSSLTSSRSRHHTTTTSNMKDHLGMYRPRPAASLVETRRSLGYTDENVSVFARLYRNEPRAETVWQPPAQFTPKKAAVMRTTHSSRASKTSIDDKTTVDATTTLEEDLDAITQLGIELLGGGETTLEPPPSVATTMRTSSLSSVWDETTTCPSNSTPTTTLNRNSDNTSTQFEPGIMTTATTIEDSLSSSSLSSVDHDVRVLEAVGKVLEVMEATNMDRLPPIPPSSSGNGPTFGTTTSTMIPSCEEGTDSITTTTVSEPLLGFFTLDQPITTRNFSSTVDDPPLSSHDYDYSKNTRKVAFSSQRHSDAGRTIQRAWRIHHAELDEAARMLHSGHVTVQCWTDPHRVREVSSTTRQRALQLARRNVQCGWILEGLQIEEERVMVAWEKDVRLGTSMVVQVELQCVADVVRTRCHWTSLKLVLLLVKASLNQALCAERAADRITRWYKHHGGKLHQNARILQLWCQKWLTTATPRNGPHREHALPSSTVSADTYVCDPSSESSDASVNLCNAVLCEIPQKEHVAAIQIQSFLRIAALKSAVKESPTIMHQLRAALKAVVSSNYPKMHRTAFDEFDVARTFLCSTMIAKHLSGSTSSISLIPAPPTLMSEKDFISQRAAAFAIHNIVRVYLTGVKKVKYKIRATMIQAIYRGYIVRKRTQLEELSAVIIQFAWGNHNYAQRKAKIATKIQRYWKTRRYKQNYDMRRFCIIFIQAGWRRAIARRNLLLFRSSTIRLQCIWKGSNERKPFLRFRSAIMTIQRLFRVRRTVDIYRNEVSNTVVMQTWWRAQNTRTLYTQKVSAASYLQPHIRGFFQRTNFVRTLREIIRIQRSWRKYNATKLFQTQKSGVILLQTLWRSYLSIQLIKRRRRSILDIQRAYRGHRCKNRLICAITNTIKLQTLWRRFHVQSVFLKYCTATLDIQRFFRGYQGRQIFKFIQGEARRTFVAKQQLNGAVVVQKAWRMFRERKWFNMTLRSTICLQSFYRKIRAQSLYRIKVRASQTIQCHWRGMVIRDGYTVIRAAAITIQAYIRGVLGKKLLKNLMNEKVAEKACILIQCQWRQAFAKQLVKNKTKEKASILIESNWRRVSTRNKYDVIRASTITIQVCARMLLAKEIKERLINEKAIIKACTLVQTNWRGSMAREKYEIARVSAITIQASVRFMLAKNFINRLIIHKITIACILIQSNWRGAMKRGNYEEARVSAINIQAFVRKMLAIKDKDEFAHENVMKKASTSIQLNWPRALAREKHDQELKYNEIKEKSSLSLQTNRRTAIARDKILRYKRLANAVTIQTVYRRISMSTRYKIMRVASITIQSTARRMQAVKYFSEVRYEKIKRSSTIVLQSYWRRAIAQNSYKNVRVAVIMIQAVARGTIAQKSVQCLKYARVVQSSTVIQLYWRRTIAQSAYRNKRKAVIIIQAIIRRLIAAKFLKDFRYERAIRSSITIQSYWRRTIARNRYSDLSVAATFMQVSAINSSNVIKQRLKHKIVKKSSVIIQSYWRGGMARNDYDEIRVAGIYIQALTRGRLARKRLESAHIAITSIQALWRKTATRALFRSFQRSLILLQCVIRGYLTRKYFHRYRNASLIQSYWRRSQARCLYCEYRVAAIIIQALIRGVDVRVQWGFVRLLSSKKHLLDEAAKTIQIAYTLWRANIAISEMRCLTVLLQRGMRGQLTRSVVRYALFHMNSLYNSTIVIHYDRLVENQEQGLQAIASWNRAVSQARESAAILIQSFLRGIITRVLIQNEFGVMFNCKLSVAVPTARIYNATIIIQNAVHTWLQSRKYSAIMIQNLVRRYFALKRFVCDENLQCSAASNIQTLLRCRNQRNVLFLQKRSTIAIQSMWRRYLARSIFLTSKTASVRIQNTYRVYIIRRGRKMVWVDCIVRLQRWARNIAAREILLNRISTDTKLTSTRIAEALNSGELKTEEICLDRLVNRVNAAWKEEESCQLLPSFCYQDPLVIPFPHSRRKLIGTAISGETDVVSKVATSHGIQVGRTTLKKSRASSLSHANNKFFANKRKAVIIGKKSKKYDRNKSIESFGGMSTMPSPIKEENTDWDWTLDW